MHTKKRRNFLKKMKLFRRVLTFHEYVKAFVIGELD